MYHPTLHTPKSISVRMMFTASFIRPFAALLIVYLIFKLQGFSSYTATSQMEKNAYSASL